MSTPINGSNKRIPNRVTTHAVNFAIFYLLLPLITRLLYKGMRVYKDFDLNANFWKGKNDEKCRAH